MIVVLLALSILWLLLAHVLRMPTVNPVSLLLVPWLIVLLVASIPGVLGNQISLATWAIVLLGIGSVACGGLAGWLVPVRTGRHESIALTPAFSSRLMRCHLSLTVSLFIYGIMQAAAAWPLVRQLGGLSVVFSASGDAGGEFKHQYSQERINAVQSSFDSGSIVSGLLGYILFLGHISLFTGAILWLFNRRLIAILPLLAAAGYSLFTLQRTSFFMCAILYIIAIYVLKKSQLFAGISHRTRKNSSLLGGITATALALMVLLYPLQQRNAGTSNSTGLISIGQYVVASIAGLNARIDVNDYSVRLPQSDATGTVSPLPGYGSYTFGGLFGILKRLGVPVPTAPHALDYYWVRIFDQSFTTNTGSSFLDFYLDFGVVGIIVLSALLGLFASACLKLALKKNIWAIPLSAFFAVSITWSFFVNALLGDFRYIYMIVVASFFLAWLIKPINSPTNGAGESIPQLRRERKPF